MGARRNRATRLCLAAILAILVLPRLAFVALSAVFPFPQRLLERLADPAAAPRVLDRDGGLLAASVGPDDAWSFPVPLDEVSPRLVQATLAAEDRRFYRHCGVDALAVARAAWSNLCHRRVVSGASTITMQVIRLLEPRRRSLRAKLAEAFRALQLEELRSKDEILTGYLNLAPYGGNLRGVEAASLAWFRKRARDLTLAEAALLAGLPQAPSRLRPDRFPERAAARRGHVLHRLVACGHISQEELRTADCALRIGERTSPNWPAGRVGAPHAAQLVRQMFPDKSLLRTTIDSRIQHLATSALREGVNGLRSAGATNGAVVVIENKTGAVRALVGSCDFFAEEDDGQVNGATAPRSPGSALKPFTYALAFERGICSLDTILADVPASYTGYEPENYDRAYRGAVPAREALAASLNVPAVKLLREVGHHSLHAFLKELGITTLRRDADYYGLALTLGSVEVTLLELTNAYATLGRLGLHRPARLLETEPVAEGRRVLSEGAAYLVAEALSGARRQGAPPLRQACGPSLRMAWKTGTSHGHRDAWTVAYTPRHTVGVWVGNFSGRAARCLLGLEAAAPTAARILDQVEADNRGDWFPMPDSLCSRPLCAVSGMPPGPHCPATVAGLVLRGHSSGRTCSVHVAARIDPGTGTSLCPRCVAGRNYVVRVCESWPVELAAWLRRHGHGDGLLPPHAPDCPATAPSDAPPRILAPANGQTYVLLADGGGEQRLSLKASGGTARLYWFVNGSLFATGSPLEPAFWPLARGDHRIVCADEAGRSAAVSISVK